MTNLIKASLAACLLAVGGGAAVADDTPRTKILFIGKDPDHPYGSHMYMHTCGVLAQCAALTPGVEAVVSNGWPKEAKTLDGVKAIVLYASPAAEMLLEGPHRAQVDALMHKGVGLVTLHWSSSVRKDDYDRLGPLWLRYLGGTWVSNVGLSGGRSPLKQLIPAHPVCRGWKEYEIDDEYYLDPILKGAKPLLQVRDRKGKEVIVGWVFERPDGGRSFGTTLGHPYSNFRIEAFRRMIVNAVLWTAHVEVPDGGAPVHVGEKDLALPPAPAAPAPAVQRNIPYANPAHERQVLDVYSPRNAKNLPVVFWIHGGGWQTGDKTDVQIKPRVFVEKGFVFVSTNYRLLPSVDMATIVGDIARSIRWVHDHIAEHGGDPQRLFIMGHSAGAQLAALICTDDRYLKAEGLSLAIIKGCVPVDGDTYDVPAIIETAETRRRVHGLPQATFGHREKFGNDPAKHRDFSAVTHVAGGKCIPPFLILHVAEHPDTSAQAQRLGNVLKEAGVPVQVFGARETTHNKINADLGLPDDPATKALFEFLGTALKK